MRIPLSRRTHRLLRLRLAGAALGLLFLADGVYAQSVRTLVIRDGKVTLDGKELPAERVPASLSQSPVEVHLQLSGMAEPAIVIAGRFYQIVGDRVEEVHTRVGMSPRPPDARRGGTADRTASAPEAAEASVPAPAADFQTRAAQFARAPVPVAGQEMLEEQALALNQIVVDLEAQSLHGYPARALAGGPSLSPATPTFRRYTPEEPGPFERAILTERLRYQSDRINQLVEDLPRIELRSYLDEVQRENVALYERLVREQRLEQESLILAGDIRALPDGPERRAREVNLRAKLEQIFALKQENRHREVVQLREKLTELQQRLYERERLHQQIIDSRIQELTGAGVRASDF